MLLAKSAVRLTTRSADGVTEKGKFTITRKLQFAGNVMERDTLIQNTIKRTNEHDY
jgi:hypothetical protein